MLVNYYYSDTLSTDPEGNLVQLCKSCALAHRRDVRLAAIGDSECSCELCDEASNSEHLPASS